MSPLQILQAHLATDDGHVLAETDWQLWTSSGDALLWKTTPTFRARASFRFLSDHLVRGQTEYVDKRTNEVRNQDFYLETFSREAFWEVLDELTQRTSQGPALTM